MYRTMIAFILIALCTLSKIAYASDTEVSIFQLSNTLNVYTDPNPHSKMTTALTSGQNIVQFFKKDGWVKIANTQTGDTGWVKQENLTNALQGKSPRPVMTSTIISQNSGTAPQKSLRVLEFYNGKMKELDSKQAEAVFKQIQLEQKKMQEELNQALSNAFQNFSFPWMQPIIIIKEPQTTVPVANQPVKK